MKIFIDSANLEEIKKYMDWGLCDGVTTNPTICLKCGVTGGLDGVKKRVQEIAQLIAPRIVSAEVTSDNPEEMLAQAREYAEIAQNIAVKITITDRDGNSLLPVIHQLAKEGIRVNVTAMMSFNQAMLAAKAISAGLKDNKNAKDQNYISIFAGRISEEHGIEHAFTVISETRKWLDFHCFDNIEIIVGSVRSPENVEYWSKTGAHILTIPPEVLAKCLTNARTKETVLQFIQDAKKSMDQLNK